MNAYLVIECQPEGVDVRRMYLDRAEADEFVVAYNATGGYLEVEEIAVGRPDVEYDGPMWVGTWSTRRKQVGVIVTDDFTMVVPSAVSLGPYRYQEMFDGPGWRALNDIRPEYEEPPVWIDSFYYKQEWHTGDHPTLAGIHVAGDNHLEVRGTSKDGVEQLLRETALQMKGGFGDSLQREV